MPMRSAMMMMRGALAVAGLALAACAAIPPRAEPPPQGSAPADPAAPQGIADTPSPFPRTGPVSGIPPDPRVRQRRAPRGPIQ
jgi:hypothetical protein